LLCRGLSSHRYYRTRHRHLEERQPPIFKIHFSTTILFELDRPLTMATLFGKKKRKRVISDQPQETNRAEKTPSDNDKVIKEEPPQYQTSSSWMTFEELGLAAPLVNTCRSLGFARPTPVQRTVIPFLLKEKSSHLLALAATGSGKSAAFILPILHHLSEDPYGIYAVVLSPTRELAKQIHQQVLALGSAYRVQSALVVGGLDAVRQSCDLDQRPHFAVATPGRLAELLRGPHPPRLQHVRYVVLDEADRLLAARSGFEKDVAELLLHCTTTKSAEGESRVRRTKCQTLLFSATLTRSLELVEEMAGAGLGRLPLRKFVIREDGPARKIAADDKMAKRRKADRSSNDDQRSESSGSKSSSAEDESGQSEEEESIDTTPSLPAGLKQEYIFMPSRVRDAFMLTTLRTLMANGGRRGEPTDVQPRGRKGSGWSMSRRDEVGEDDDLGKARSAIIFVSTCERAAFVSGVLSEVGVENVALHSLLSQNRRLAALGKFKSQHVRILVATDVASRGLDIPTVDLVLNAELPRNAVSYVHRVGRTARAGRRGRAISLVGESDVALVHAAERITGRSLEKCTDITDDMAIKMLGPVTKAARLARRKLMDIGFDDLVKKMKERKVRDRKERQRREQALKKIASMK
jgi:ATP-dependent RNA helicase DDX49/DBP8